MCSDIPKLLLNVLSTHVCVLMFLNLYLSVVAGSIPVGALINIPGWTHMVLVLSLDL